MLREEVRLGATRIEKAGFFAIFQQFRDRTFTPQLCKSAFRKIGLIPFDPEVIIDKVRKEYGGIIEDNGMQKEALEELVEDTIEEAFGIPLPRSLPNWARFKTPSTLTDRTKGV
jgi:hypothetical protein